MGEEEDSSASASTSTTLTTSATLSPRSRTSPRPPSPRSPSPRCHGKLPPSSSRGVSFNSLRPVVPNSDPSGKSAPRSQNSSPSLIHTSHPTLSSSHQKRSPLSLSSESRKRQAFKTVQEDTKLVTQDFVKESDEEKGDDNDNGHEEDHTSNDKRGGGAAERKTDPLPKRFRIRSEAEAETVKVLTASSPALMEAIFSNEVRFYFPLIPTLSWTFTFRLFLQPFSYPYIVDL